MSTTNADEMNIRARNNRRNFALFENAPTKDYGSFSCYMQNVRDWITEYKKWEKHCLDVASSYNTNTATTENAPNLVNVFIRASNSNDSNTGTFPMHTVVRPASLLRRGCAELIDGALFVFVKFAIVYLLLDLNIIDFGDYEKAITEELDIVEFMMLTQSLLPLEFLCKFVCGTLEAFLMAFRLGNKLDGQTPGKFIMNIRVVGVEQVRETPAPEMMRVSGVRQLSLKKCLLRSYLKNMVVNGFFPLSTFVFLLPSNRLFYDLMTSSIVICQNV